MGKRVNIAVPQNKTILVVFVIFISLSLAVLVTYTIDQIDDTSGTIDQIDDTSEVVSGMD